MWRLSWDEARGKALAEKHAEVKNKIPINIISQLVSPVLEVRKFLSYACDLSISRMLTDSILTIGYIDPHPRF
jgi:hypothetical protein